MAPKLNESREKPHEGWTQAGADNRAATTFAGNIMAIAALVLLFDDEDGASHPD